jgi:putative endonuclease
VLEAHRSQPLALRGPAPSSGRPEKPRRRGSTWPVPEGWSLFQPSPPVSRERKDRGDRGESLAAEHLTGLGWKILERGWRCRAGELDLVAQDGDTVVFVEVRARAAGSKVAARESFGAGKQNRVARAALHYIRDQKLANRRFRFDVVAVELGPPAPRLEHIKAAFELPRQYW